MIHPDHVVERWAYGKADMGDVTDRTSRARFGLSKPYSILSIQARVFSGADGDNLLRLRYDDPRGSQYDFTPRFWENFGVGAEDEIFDRFDENELTAMGAYAVNGVVGQYCFEWSNPSTLSWAILLRLILHENISHYLPPIQRV